MIYIPLYGSTRDFKAPRDNDDVPSRLCDCIRAINDLVLSWGPPTSAEDGAVDPGIGKNSMRRHEASIVSVMYENGREISAVAANLKGLQTVSGSH